MNGTIGTRAIGDMLKMNSYSDLFMNERSEAGKRSESTGWRGVKGARRSLCDQVIVGPQCPVRPNP